MKSLKNVYKELMNEEISYKNTDIAQLENLKVYYGNFNSDALSLWNEKDGSGGRGEYTVASHFLKFGYKEKYKFERKSEEKFYSDLTDSYYFIERYSKIDLVNDDIDAIRTKLTDSIKSLGLEVIVKDNNISRIKDGTITTGSAFIVSDNGGNKYSTWGSSIKFLNRILFDKDIEEEKRNNDGLDIFPRRLKTLFDLINSVTTGGSDSQSTDVSISNDRISTKMKNILNIGNNDLKIEVKEISSVTNTVDGSGIRLASGSKVASAQNDIILCLSTIATVTDIAENETFDKEDYEGHLDAIPNLAETLYALKVNQVSSTKLKDLVNNLCSKHTVFLSLLYNLISKTEMERLRKNLAWSAYDLLEKILDKPERQMLVRSSLDSIISKSIKADYLCILHGLDSSVYRKNPSAKGNLQFLLIHKDEFDKVLGFSSYQNGGTAYTSIKKRSVADFLEKFFVKENFLYDLDKKQLFLERLKLITINEGALGGHMMHPYEALDMTPEQLASRIKQYGVPQKIIEKVDGQNLFFTVEPDGTLLFARNKEDMTHDDLVEKFTGHPAEKPFIEGGNAIKSGVESLLNSISQEEVIRLFHPSEGIRTFVNFEIMHPEKPNQIIYDEKYIVFHGIVDYRNGREEVSRSNQDQRIQELVSLMSSGVSSAGFTLASNREVDLNQLTDIQIAMYTQKIYDISKALGMEEGETLGDGIMNVIGDEIEAEGVSLSDEALTIFTDYIIRGEDSEGRSIASREWTKLLSKEDVVKLRQLGLTSTTKVKSKIGQILQPYKALFVELGIDLLKGVQSSYMSADMNIENVELIRDKLSTAISDLENYINSVPEEEWSSSIKRLIPHMELINRKGLDNIVSSAVEGGVYSANDNLFKVTGGFAPMNQIIGAAYRDKEDIFTTFKEKFMQQENNRRSLRDIFSLIF